MSFAAITRMTFADAVRQPATWLTALLGLSGIGLSYLFGMFTFEVDDRVRMLCTAGVATVIVAGVVLAALLASIAVHQELADRTALTLFAKPVSRAAFLFGKACGVWLTVVAVSLLLIAVHLIAIGVSLRTGFEWERRMMDAVDTGAPWGAVIAAHGLALCHAACFACVAAVLATRLPLIATLASCALLFVAGHVLASTGMLGALAVPALSVFTLDDAIQLDGHPVTAIYLATTVLYCVLFCAGCLFSGLAWFADQDIR